MRRSVLVVDDNHAFREAVRQLLTRGGFVVVAEAENGREGIRQAAAHRPDVAIVDVQLPDIDGFEVAEEIGGLGLDLQVILTSSLDGADFGALVTDSPAAGFVPKAELSSAAIDALLVPPR